MSIAASKRSWARGVIPIGSWSADPSGSLTGPDGTRAPVVARHEQTGIVRVGPNEPLVVGDELLMELPDDPGEHGKGVWVIGAVDSIVVSDASAVVSDVSARSQSRAWRLRRFTGVGWIVVDVAAIDQRSSGAVGP